MGEIRERGYTVARTCSNLPPVHSFVRGLRLDHDAVHAALTSAYHNGDTEGVNTKTKLIKDRCTAGQASTSCATAGRGAGQVSRFLRDF